MKLFYVLVIAVLLAMTAANLVVGQPNAPKPIGSLPFATGERLTYEGKISKFVSITIGDLSFEVLDAVGDKLQLKADARSRGTMLKLFRYSFSQDILTLVDAKDLHAITDKKHDVQKQRIRDSVTAFDYDRKMVTWVETNPGEPTMPARTIASDLDGPTHNIVSGIYFLRTLPLAVGYSTTVNASDSGLVYKIPVRVAAREVQKTVLGKIWCWLVEPDLFGPGRFFEQNGKMEIWISDDARKIPVRARVNAEVGKVDIKLKETTNVKMVRVS